MCNAQCKVFATQDRWTDGHWPAGLMNTTDCICHMPLIPGTQMIYSVLVGSKPVQEYWSGSGGWCFASLKLKKMPFLVAFYVVCRSLPSVHAGFFFLFCTANMVKAQTGLVNFHTLYLMWNFNNNNNNNNRIQRRYSRLFTSSSQRREQSPSCTLKWPRRNHVQLTCNTSSAYHVQVSCYMPLRTKGQLSY